MNKQTTAGAAATLATTAISFLSRHFGLEIPPDVIAAASTVIGFGTRHLTN